jgi:excisionase family DNA binding protein
MSRPRATLAEVRAVARSVATLGTQIERLTVAVDALRAGQPSQLGRVEDVCRILGISPATLHRRIADGSIPCIRHGRTLRFDLAALTPAAPTASLQHRDGGGQA